MALYKWADKVAWSAGAGFTPGSWTTGQVLTKTASGYAWDDVPTELPSSGTTWHVLTKTADGNAWSAIPEQIVYITQDDYDLLPSSKLTDWINYVIIEEDS